MRRSVAQPQIVVGKSADRQQVCEPRAGASSELRPGREVGERERESKNTSVALWGRLGKHGDHDNFTSSVKNSQHASPSELLFRARHYLTEVPLILLPRSLIVQNFFWSLLPPFLPNFASTLAPLSGFHDHTVEVTDRFSTLVCLPLIFLPYILVSPHPHQLHTTKGRQDREGKAQVYYQTSFCDKYFRYASSRTMHSIIVTRFSFFSNKLSKKFSKKRDFMSIL